MTTCSEHVFMSIGLLAICTYSSANSLLISLADFLIQCLEFLEHLTKSEYLFFIKCGLQILARMLSVDGWWSVPSLYSSFFGWCDPISLILPVFLGSHLRIPCQCQHFGVSPTLSWLLFRSKSSVIGLYACMKKYKTLTRTPASCFILPHTNM